MKLQFTNQVSFYTLNISISIINKGLICTIIHLWYAKYIFSNTHISLIPCTKKENNGEILHLKIFPGDLGRCMSLLYFPRPCPASLDIYRIATPWPPPLTHFSKQCSYNYYICHPCKGCHHPCLHHLQHHSYYSIFVCGIFRQKNGVSKNGCSIVFSKCD